MIRMGGSRLDHVSKENVRTKWPRTPSRNKASQDKAVETWLVHTQLRGAFPPSEAMAPHSCWRKGLHVGSTPAI